MAPTFAPAVKYGSKARIALAGPSGSGKTWTSLAIARGLVGPEGRIGLVDTEHGSASKYADMFRFDALELDTFSPQTYIDAINAAARARYDALILDSLSHAWMGKDGALELVDRAKSRNQGNSFAGWKDVTPLQMRLVDTMLAAPLHLIATLRVKTEWVVEKTEKGSTPRKIGLTPVQRDGIEYEFDIVGDLDDSNRMVVSKSRCPKLARAVIDLPGEDVGRLIAEWLDGEPEPEPAESAPPAAAEPQPDRAELEAAWLRVWEESASLNCQPKITVDLAVVTDAKLAHFYRQLKDRVAHAQAQAEYMEQLPA